MSNQNNHNKAHLSCRRNNFWLRVHWGTVYI